MLREYQQRDKAAVYDALQKHHSVLYQLPTGGGKTVLVVDLIKEELLKGGRPWFIMHREELIQQSFQTLYRNKILPGIIKGDVKTDFSLRCQVASIQTLIRRKIPHEPTLIIFDEAHHVQDDNTYGQLVKRYPRAKILGVTATPYRLSGEGFRGIFETMVQSCRPNYIDLVNDGYLTPLKYFVSAIPDLTGVHISGGDYVQKELEEKMKLAPIVESYFQHAKGLKGIVFCVNINHSKRVAEQYKAAGIPAKHVDGDTPDEERARAVSDFKKGLVWVLTNVGIFTEGTDVPDMDFVQLAAPTKSLSKYLQEVGRASRVAPGCDAPTPEERRAKIAASPKNKAIILDNAGLWLEHGLPDQKFNWQYYFQGTKRLKKEEPVEFIEIFVAEDPETKQTVRTKNPREIEGMVLIEVTKEVREKQLNISSLKKFDEIWSNLVELKNRADNKHRYENPDGGARTGGIQKPGILALFEYIKYCRSKNILIEPKIWEYIEKKLVLDRQNNAIKINNEHDDRIIKKRQELETELFKTHEEKSRELWDFIERNAKERDRRLKNNQAAGIPSAMLATKRAEYEREIKKAQTLV